MKSKEFMNRIGGAFLIIFSPIFLPIWILFSENSWKAVRFYYRQCWSALMYNEDLK